MGPWASSLPQAPCSPAWGHSGGAWKPHGHPRCARCPCLSSSAPAPPASRGGDQGVRGGEGPAVGPSFPAACPRGAGSPLCPLAGLLGDQRCAPVGRRRAWHPRDRAVGPLLGLLGGHGARGTCLGRNVWRWHAGGLGKVVQLKRRVEGWSCGHVVGCRGTGGAQLRVGAGMEVWAGVTGAGTAWGGSGLARLPAGHSWVLLSHDRGMSQATGWPVQKGTGTGTGCQRAGGRAPAPHTCAVHVRARGCRCPDPRWLPKSTIPPPLACHHASLAPWPCSPAGAQGWEQLGHPEPGWGAPRAHPPVGLSTPPGSCPTLARG